MSILFVMTLAAVSSQTLACDPQTLLADMHSAAGGTRWEAVAGIVADGRIEDSGLSGPFQLTVDLRRGRSKFTEDPGLAHAAYFYDGTTKWRQDFTYGVVPLDTADAKAQATTDAYLDRHGYWFSASDPAEFACLGARTEDGGKYAVLQVTPRNGRPAELWINASTHLLDRITEHLPASVQITRYGDYRRDSGLMLPHRITISTVGQADTVVEEISHYSVPPAVSDQDFVRPADPSDWTIADEAESTTVPIVVDGGIIYLDARVDGKGPFTFIFDPGAPGVLTADTAIALGMGAKAGDIVKTQSLDVGQIEIRHLPFLVASGGDANSFPPRPSGSPPAAGTLGPELLERFAVRVDYAKRTLTFTPLAKFHYRESGIPVPFSFEEAANLVPVPLISGEVDGQAGQFQLDYRAPGRMALFQPFLQEHGFFERYPGSTQSPRQTVASVELAGAKLQQVSAYFLTGDSGMAAIRTQAGRLGHDVLSQFTTTLDYRHEIAYFQPATWNLRD